MSKRMLIMLIFTGLLFVGIFSYKAFQTYMMKKYMNGASPPVVISAMAAIPEAWQSKLSSTGTLRAINGVDVTTEIAGLVKDIKFIPGSHINLGEVMVELNADVEISQLKSLEAAAELAQITYDRDKEQFAIEGVSKATLDTDAADLKSKKAQVAQQAAVVAKKTVKAPFKGHLGISAVNLGQYLNPGDKIVTLQALDPIHVNFFLPQQKLPYVAMNQPVTFKVDTYPNLTFNGKISSINPKVDPATRNVELEATIPNPDYKLLPGMYAEVIITTGKPKDYLTLPQTAISYNPYGNLVYTLKEKGKNDKGAPLFIATQKFVTVGETRGDQVQVIKGIDKGDVVVTAGQIKLKNGSLVVIDNTVVPSNNPAPNVKNE